MSIHQYQRYEYGEHKLEECPMRIGLRICSLLKLNPYDVIFEKIDETEIQNCSAKHYLRSDFLFFRKIRLRGRRQRQQGMV